jgi:hypothetical protein
VSPRFAVLERMGLIEQVGKHPCPVTGRSTVFFRSTNEKPRCSEGEALKPKKSRVNEAALLKQIEDLKKENAQLMQLLEIRRAKYANREEKLKAARIEIQETLF